MEQNNPPVQNSSIVPAQNTNVSAPPITTTQTNNMFIKKS